LTLTAVVALFAAVAALTAGVTVGRRNGLIAALATIAGVAAAVASGYAVVLSLALPM
jgi:hypothetical protein